MNFRKLIVIFFLIIPFSLPAEDASICSPDILEKYGTLTLTPPKVNVKLNLAIVDPLGNWFYLPMQSTIVPFTAKGTVYVNGVKKEEHIFKVDGTYRVIMAENLETEPENTVWFEKKIQYITPRK